jgi:predicted acyl esterase
MRDGVRLSTDLYFPAQSHGPLPAILWRSIYDKQGAYGREPGMRELLAHAATAVEREGRHGRLLVARRSSTSCLALRDERSTTASVW